MGCNAAMVARGDLGGWCLVLRKDQTGSCPLNRAMNWVKLTLGDATVAVCKMAALPAPPAPTRVGVSGALRAIEPWIRERLWW